jgi:hypothetical protein
VSVCVCVLPPLLYISPVSECRCVRCVGWVAHASFFAEDAPLPPLSLVAVRGS